MTELDKTALPQMLAFLDGLTELLDEEAQERRGESGPDEDDQGEDRFEEGIYEALRKLNNTADKAMAIAVARGYFEVREANSRFPECVACDLR